MAEPLSLESHEIGGQPLIAPFLDRLGLRTFFEGALGEADRRLRLSHTKTACQRRSVSAPLSQRHQRHSAIR